VSNRAGFDRPLDTEAISKTNGSLQAIDCTVTDSQTKNKQRKHKNTLKTKPKHKRKLALVECKNCFTDCML